MKPTIFFLSAAITTTIFAQQIDIKDSHLKEQMEKEKKFAKEQKFYQGDEYDLRGAEVDKKSVDKVPKLEPDYDFDITDVYRDDI